jgi:predicted alpha/beta hydrolase
VTDDTYWDFGWQEMGIYDIPATFDYIAEVNGHREIAYIGHSMGTTQMFYALA